MLRNTTLTQADCEQRHCRLHRLTSSVTAFRACCRVLVLSYQTLHKWYRDECSKSRQTVTVPHCTWIPVHEGPIHQWHPCPPKMFDRPSTHGSMSRVSIAAPPNTLPSRSALLKVDHDISLAQSLPFSINLWCPFLPIRTPNKYSITTATIHVMTKLGIINAKSVTVTNKLSWATKKR